MGDRSGKRLRSASPFSRHTLATQLSKVEDALPCDDLIATIENDGKVAPMVHSLLMKQKLPHATLKDTTGTLFTAGNPNDDMEIELRRTTIEKQWTNDAFFDTDGLAAAAMIEKVPGDPAWEYSPTSADFAVHLLNTPAEMVGQGIEVTDLPHLELVEQKRDETKLVTRPESRGVVASAFARVAQHSQTSGLATAITGAPGIGKSWTLIYVLQQALLYEDACVIFFNQKMKSAYLFIRRGDVIYAWEMTVESPASLFCRLIPALALLDPIEARNGGAKLPVARCAILYAASNNEAHFKEGSSKVQAKVERYLGPPSVDQLRVILNYVNVDVDEKEEAIKRADDVNNLLRYITDSERYVERKQAIDTALRDLEDRNMKAILNADGRSLLDDEGSFGKIVLGTLFLVGPETCVASEDDHEDNPVADRMADDGHAHGVGGEVPPCPYDGEGINYQTRVIIVATEKVYNKVLSLNRESIVSFWGLVHCDNSARMGRKLKKLFADDLKNPKGVTVKTQQCKIRSKDELESPRKLILRDRGVTSFDDLQDHNDAWDRLGVIFTSADTSAAMPDCFPVIDAAGPGRRVYQVTTGEDHTKKASGMLKLLIEAGLLTQGSGGELMEVAAGSIDFYWVVPPARFNRWTQRVAKRYTAEVPHNWDDGSLTHKKRRLEQLEHSKGEGPPMEETKKGIEAQIAELQQNNWAVFRHCFHNQVKQFVLEMPLNPTFAFAIVE